MTEKEYPYLDMYLEDGSGVALEHLQNSRSVDLHRHPYYELLFVERGSCRHFYNGAGTLLIPGDIVLIEKKQEHGYALRGEISLYNCQFSTEYLSEEVLQNIEKVGLLRKPEEREHASEVIREKTVPRENLYADIFPDLIANNSKQGVIHLPPAEQTYFLSVFQHLLAEQERPEPSALLKQRYVEVILLELKKILRNQNEVTISFSGENQKIIAEVLMEMDMDLTRPFDINSTAERYGFSPNYFRKLFKDYTGLSPVQYLNRTRIMLADELMERQGKSISEAAEAVGIYDMNYFSRLFKKIFGCAPSRI